jgi:hypothetical protein
MGGGGGGGGGKVARIKQASGIRAAVVSAIWELAPPG